jgi:succinate-acetate transporter protein
MIYGVQGVAALGMLVGQVLVVGGIGMLISGFWCYQAGATFATTAFGMYGLFYISLGVTLYPEAGVGAAYPLAADYNSALGLYLLVWFLLSFVMWPVTWRLNVGLAALCEFTLILGDFLFFPTRANLFSVTFVCFYFLFLTIGFLTGNVTIIHTGAAFGMIVGGWSYILGMSELYAAENCIFQIPNPSLARKTQ